MEEKKKILTKDDIKKFNSKIIVKKEDLIETLYFIIFKVQQDDEKCNMRSGISGKTDFLGGYIDRFINTFPEKILFNETLLKKAGELTGTEVKTIPDFYVYDPKSTTPTADLIGIKVNNNITIPFTVFNDGWEKVSGAPQFEVKTSKNNQYLVSCDNKEVYDDDYLVFVESEFRNDYLLSFFDNELFSSDIVNKISGYYNDAFVKSDTEGKLSKINTINLKTNEKIGEIKLLGIIKQKTFFDSQQICEKGDEIWFIKNIEEYSLGNTNKNAGTLSKYCNENEKNGLYFWNENYKKNSGNDDYNSKLLDFYCDNPDNILVYPSPKKGKTKFSKSTLYIKASDKAIINNEVLEKGKTYKITFDKFSKSSNSKECFAQKTALSHFKDYETTYNEAVASIVNIINENIK